LTIEDKAAEYLRKAKDAQERAAKAQHSGEKQAWEQIAASYLDLAAQPKRWR